MSTRPGLGDVTESERVVAEFSAAWTALDLDAVEALLADDAVYQSGPFPPVRGRAEIGRLLRHMTRDLTQCDFEIVHMASRGSVVFTERADLVGTTRGRAVLPVVSVFEVHTGTISAWREYFDLDQHTTLMAPIALRP